MIPETYDLIRLAYGDDDVPEALVGFFEHLDETIKNANGMSFVQRDEFGIRSSQIVSLVVLLWKMGVINDTQTNPTN